MKILIEVEKPDITLPHVLVYFRKRGYSIIKVTNTRLFAQAPNGISGVILDSDIVDLGDPEALFYYLATSFGYNDQLLDFYDAIMLAWDEAK